MISRVILLVALMVTSFNAFAADDAPQRWTSLAPQRVTSLRKGAAKILPDKSVEFDLPNANWQEPAFHFSFRDGCDVREVRLEILADKRFPDRRVGRSPEITVMLFDLKPTLHVAKKKYQTQEFVRCENPADPDDEYVHGLVDYASDTGWEAPKLKQGQEAIELVFGFDEPVAVAPQDELILHLDSGGYKWSAPARVRFSFSNHADAR